VDKINLELIGGILAIAVQAGIAVWWASGVNSKMFHIEHELMKLNMNVEQNTEFRILWPRGEMGAFLMTLNRIPRFKYCRRRLKGLDSGQYVTVKWTRKD